MDRFDFRKGYKIYYNLNKHCFSILAHDIKKKGWRLYKHSLSFKANDVKFTVGLKARERTLKEKVRNVHAYAYASNIEFSDYNINNRLNKVSYNPYKHPYFYNLDTNEKVSDVDTAYMIKNLIYVGNKKGLE